MIDETNGPGGDAPTRRHGEGEARRTTLARASVPGIDGSGGPMGRCGDAEHAESNLHPPSPILHPPSPIPHPPSSILHPPSPLQIAIDGPAGAGKSTVARGVAAALGFIYVDTGAMYRAIALKVLRQSAEEASWGALAESASLRFVRGSGGQHTILDGEDVEDAIRAPEISDWSSRVSADPRVRTALTSQMQKMAATVDVVMEGRDIGTVVLPNATLKIFLTAPASERARRRTAELEGRGKAAAYDEVLADIEERDMRDATRADAPLVKADDAVEVDTGGLTPDEVIDTIVALMKTRQCK